MLDLFVEIDAEENPEEGKQVHLDRKSYGERDQNEVESERWADTRSHGRGEDFLNRALLRNNDRENFSEDPAE